SQLNRDSPKQAIRSMWQKRHSRQNPSDRAAVEFAVWLSNALNFKCIFAVDKPPPNWPKQREIGALWSCGRFSR
ncbi:MAG TPA: hypothetical protein VHD36_02160, partial [Pirellulales bacterium]|nr:hypothetical protein [Pirellulales bacterium]